MERIVFPSAVGLFLLLALVLPAVRMRVRAGTWGIAVHRHGVQRLVGAAMALAIASLVGFLSLYAALGPAALGVVAAPAWLSMTGWVLVAGGLAVVVTAQAQMGRSWRIGIDERPTALVTSGLYALVRNPIYSAMSLSLAGAAAIAPGVCTAFLFSSVTLVMALQTRLEERHLLTLHGANYARYAARVGRFVPGIGRIQEG
jgi:protein-S-isoprenylcysteine O-methyltransferase Ste14